LEKSGRVYLCEKPARSRRTGDKKPHQSQILEPEFHGTLGSQGTITLWRKDYSPVRYIVVTLFERVALMSRAIARMVMSIDYFVIATLGGIIPWFDRRAVFAKVEKRHTP
jgi:hypothetical protein